MLVVVYHLFLIGKGQIYSVDTLCRLCILHTHINWVGEVFLLADHNLFNISTIHAILRLTVHLTPYLNHMKRNLKNYCPILSGPHFDYTSRVP